MTMIAPCLWYDGQAEQAATFYVSLFPDSRIDKVMRAPGDYPAGQQGDALLIDFTLDGRSFQAMNGGPGVPFTDALSLSVSVSGQAEVDRLWDALTADGGEEVACGWLKDRWGVSWQIVPDAMLRCLGGSDAEGSRRAFEAMQAMVKIDAAAIEAAYEGKASA